MRHFHSRLVSASVVTLLTLTAFFVGYQMKGNHTGGLRPVWASMIPTSSPIDDSVSLKPIQLIQEAFVDLQREYVDPITDPDELTYAAIRGMLSHVKDPYTRFMDPKEFKEFNEQNEGHFVGIGATLNMEEIPSTGPKQEGTAEHPFICPVCKTNLTEFKQYRATVVKPLPNSPALKAGLEPGDVILKVDDMATEGLLLDDVVEKIRGQEGTKVTLSLLRKGTDKPFDITITRAPIEVPAVESKILDGQIGYLHLFSFNEKTVNETRAALMDFNQAGVQGMILDLRSNPGGLLTECVKVASMLLPTDQKVIVSIKARDRRQQDETRIGRELFDRPIVVLVNKGSASASEILTGALKDYKRATIVGETTFGKALVQTVILLGDTNDRCAMPVTTARYYTPSGYNLNKKGIAPDVEVKLDEKVKDLSENDNQAQAALKILREEMAKTQ